MNTSGAALYIGGISGLLWGISCPGHQRDIISTLGHTMIHVD